MSEASGLVASASLPMLRAVKTYRERYTGQLLELAGDLDLEPSPYDGGGGGGSNGGIKPTAIHRLVRDLALAAVGRRSAGMREGAEGAAVAGGVQAVAARNQSFVSSLTVARGSQPGRV